MRRWVNRAHESHGLLAARYLTVFIVNSGTCGRPRLLTATASPLQSKLHCVCTHFAGQDRHKKLAESRSRISRIARSEVPDSFDCQQWHLWTTTATQPLHPRYNPNVLLSCLWISVHGPIRVPESTLTCAASVWVHDPKSVCIHVHLRRVP